MSILQWLLLILAITAVISFYLWTRRRGGPDPWEPMRDSGEDDQEAEHLEKMPEELDDTGDMPFDGMVGADDIPDMPEDLPGADDELVFNYDLPDYDVQDEQDDNDSLPESGPELRPGKLKHTVQPEDQRIVVLHVACKQRDYFSGEAIHEALRSCRLQFGMQEVYHRMTEENGVPESVFSVANMLKPGYLNPDEAGGLETPGITLFMVLPGPLNGSAAFRDMLETANQLAEKLGGEVLDDQRALLTWQTAQYLMDEIAEDQRKLQIKQNA